VDFADVKAVMQNMGYALMGTGISEGENRAINAARAAIDNPLLSDISLNGCQSLLLNITAGQDILMSEIEEVSNVIVNETGRGANIIMGVIMEENMTGKISVTIIATGLNKNEQSNNLLEFPTFNPNTPLENEAPGHIAKDEISNILKTLGINSQSTEEKPNHGNAEDPTRIKPMRTDVPSFLKALD
jgi:cell division protein FtsZ